MKSLAVGTVKRNGLLNVLIICYVFPPEGAPAGVMVSELAEDLAGRGHKVTVLTGWPNHPTGRLFPGYRATWRAMQPYGPYRVMRTAHSLYAKTSALGRLWMYLTFAVSSFVNGMTLGKQDVVVCLSTPLFGVWTAWLLARLWRGRFVNVIFDLWPEAIKNAGLVGENAMYRLIRRIDTWNCRLSDQITTLGEGMKTLICQRVIDPEKVKVLPFWMDTDRIRPLPKDNPWRQRQGIATDRFVALFAGTIGYASGAEILADVAGRLAAYPRILLLVVGEGVVKENLQTLAVQRKVDNMRFMPFQPEQDLAQMQSTADVGLVTLRPASGVSSVPSKVLGYMSAGRAVIAAAAADTDTAALITEAQCGIVTPAGDAAGMADAILRLYRDPGGCQQYGDHGRQYILTHLSRQTIVDAYARLIEGQ